MLKHLVISLLALALSLETSQGQQKIIRDRGEEITFVSGPTPGSKLIFRDGKSVFYANSDWSGIRPATRSEFPSPTEAWKYHLRGYLYAETPTGALVWRKTKGHLYRQERVSQPMTKVTQIVPAYNALDSRDDTPYFEFVNDRLGFTYMSGSTEIYRTTNAGTTWTHQGNMKTLINGKGIQGFIRNIHFIDSKLGFACVQMHEKGPWGVLSTNEFLYLMILRTQDAGKTWERVQISKKFESHYLLGEVYYHTRDGGSQNLSLYGYGDSVVYDSSDGGATFVAREVKDHKQHWSPVHTKTNSVIVDSVNYAPFQVFFFNLSKGNKK